MSTNFEQDNTEMGSSQSKFKPKPTDIWYKIKVTPSQPQYLQTVLQAIVNLGETHGSSQGRIIDYIQSVINAKQIRPRPRNIAMKIKGALKYALHNNLVKQRGGKFIMALTPKEYAIFRGFRSDKEKKDSDKTERRKSKSENGKRSSKQSRKRCRERCSDYSDDDFEFIRPKKRQKLDHIDYDSDESSDDLSILSTPSSCSSTSIRKSDSYVKKKMEQIYNSSKHSMHGSTSAAQIRRKNNDPDIAATSSTVEILKPCTSKASSSKFKQDDGGSSNK